MSVRLGTNLVDEIEYYLSKFVEKIELCREQSFRMKRKELEIYC
ncbi:MAG: hypothetical protein PHT78_12490 [Desulfitobacteriaceae bacterium]|nr:hypothetical protein [Desulfitobacteriaceae bacterium]